MKLLLGALARIQISGILAAQRADIKSIIVLSELNDKIEIEESERAKLLTPAGNGQMIIDPEAVKAFGDTEIDLEKAEARKLREVLNAFNGYGPADVKWVNPVLKALEVI